MHTKAWNPTAGMDTVSRYYEKNEIKFISEDVCDFCFRAALVVSYLLRKHLLYIQKLIQAPICY